MGIDKFESRFVVIVIVPNCCRIAFQHSKRMRNVVQIFCAWRTYHYPNNFTFTLDNLPHCSMLIADAIFAIRKLNNQKHHREIMRDRCAIFHKFDITDKQHYIHVQLNKSTLTTSVLYCHLLQSFMMYVLVWSLWIEFNRDAKIIWCNYICIYVYWNEFIMVQPDDWWTVFTAVRQRRKTPSFLLPFTSRYQVHLVVWASYKQHESLSKI